MGWRAELAKRWRARASAISLILALIVLIDELIKENSSFDISDLLAWPPPSHEQLFLIFLIAGLLLGVRWRGRG
jgi:hypothetical protein